MSEQPIDSNVNRLGELALQLSWIQAKDLSAALKLQADLKADGIYKPLGTILVEKHKLTEEQLKDLLERQSELWEGNRIVGRYRLLAKIGEGGMGAVWKAEHLELGNAVAIKLLPRSLIGDQLLVKRFEREARILAGINHNNIVQAFDAGEHEGQPYFVMPYVNGASLGELIRSCGILDVPTALSITLQILRGLQYAHDRGIIHRDLKPDNIALTNDGTVKILDLGLTKIMEQSVSDGQFAPASDSILGTPYHMSPEQILCDPNLDRRSDLYSLGSTLFQMICGRVPFYGKTVPEVLRKKLDSAPPDPLDLVPSLPPGVRKLILRLLARSPDDRPQSAAEVEEWIEDFLDHRPITGARLSPGKIVLSKRSSHSFPVKTKQAKKRMLHGSNETSIGATIDTELAASTHHDVASQEAIKASHQQKKVERRTDVVHSTNYEKAAWKKSTRTVMREDEPFPFHNPATTTMLPPYLRERTFLKTRVLESTKRTYRPSKQKSSTRITPPTSELKELRVTETARVLEETMKQEAASKTVDGGIAQLIAIGVLVVVIGFIVMAIVSIF